MKRISKPNGQVLVVEDDESELRLFEIAFDEVDEDIRVTSANDGEQAVELLRAGGSPTDTHPPDLLILDLDNPKSNGIQVLRRFHDDEVPSEIPIVVCSHHIGQETIDACYELGAKACFVKPLDYGELLHIANHITTLWTDDAVDATVRDGLEPAHLNVDSTQDGAVSGLVHEASKWNE